MAKETNNRPDSNEIDQRVDQSADSNVNNARAQVEGSGAVTAPEGMAAATAEALRLAGLDLDALTPEQAAEAIAQAQASAKQALLDKEEEEEEEEPSETEQAAPDGAAAGDAGAAAGGEPIMLAQAGGEEAAAGAAGAAVAGSSGGLSTGAMIGIGAAAVGGIALAAGGGGGGGGGDDDPVPSATDDAFTTNEDTLLNGNVATNDASQGSTPAVYSVAAGDGPANGAVTMNADGSFSYTPNANFNGSDSFTYTVVDANGDVDTGVVNLTVNPVNDAPVAAGDAFTTNDNLAFDTGNALANDNDPADGDTLAVTAVDTTGTLGSVVNNGDGTFNYDPTTSATLNALAPGESATDTFSYTVSDGNGGTDTATVTITVTGANDAPVANNDAFSTDEDTALVTGDATANDSDIEGNALTVIAIDTTATQGTVLDNGDGTFTYDPNGAFESLGAGESATDAFSYTISDGAGGTDTATVTVTVNGVNDAPVATDDNAATTEDATPALAGNVLANDSDVDGDSLTVSPTGNVAAGLVVNADGSYTFNPADPAYQSLGAGDTDLVVYNYTVSDGNGGSDTGVLSITVSGTNDVPIATADSFSATENGAVVNGTVATNDVDVDDGDPLTFSAAAGQAAVAGLTFNADGSFSFNPGDPAYDAINAGETRAVIFNYEVTDSQGAFDTATLTINVTGANDTPMANDDSASVSEDAVINGSVATNDTDADASAVLSFAAEASQGPVAGLTFNADGSYSFDASNAAYQDLGVGESETVTFDYTVTDDIGASSNAATLTITVNGTNDAPVAGGAESFEVLQDTTLTVPVFGLLANDTDIDNIDAGDVASSATPIELSSVLVSGTANGALTLNADGSFTYIPNPGFFGMDGFTYRVQDVDGGSSGNVTVTLTVTQTDFIFTPGTDNFVGDPAVDETFLGTNNNINAGDVADGGAGGTDRVIHRLDGGAGSQTFAGFQFDGMEEFEVTSDTGLGGTTAYDLSTSGSIGTLTATNSTDDIAFNNASVSDPATNTTFLQILNQTSDTTDVTLDIDNTQVAGTSDTVDITVSDGNGGGAVDDITIDGAVENIAIHTTGPLAVVIDDLDAGAGGTGATNLTLDAQSAALTITNPLTASVINVDGTSSTQNLSYDASAAANGAGSVTLSGGAGNDSILGSTADSNAITGNAGADTLTGGNVNDTISGNDGADTLNGGAGNDILDGGADGDTINTGAGNDTVTGGLGNDTVNDGAGSSTINTNDDADTVNLGADDGSAVRTVDGVLISGDAVDTGAGNDTVNAGANLEATDRLDGGADTDRLNITADNVATDLDNVTGFETIHLASSGSAYNYVITNNSLFDNDSTGVTIDGSDIGSDALTFNATTLSRSITIIGDNAGDALTGGSAADLLIGDSDGGADGGDDTLTGNGGDDTFQFDGGQLTAADVIFGDGNPGPALPLGHTAGTDTIELLDDAPVDNAGNEELFTLNLGANASVENVLVVDNSNGGDVQLDIASTFAQNLGAIDLTVDASALDSNEGLDFRAGNNNGTGFAVTSGAGGDIILLDTAGGSDSVDTGAGNDAVTTGGGSDNIATGDGADAVDTGTNPASTTGGNLTVLDTLDGGAGLDRLDADAGTVDADYTNVSNFETLALNNAGTTTLAGQAQEAGIRTVQLSAGADTLNAGAYTEDLTVFDNGGDDVVTTGSGNDTIFQGDDGAVGPDTATDSYDTGAGDDTIVTEGNRLDVTDTIAAGTGNDTVLLDNEGTVDTSVTADVNLDTVTGVENFVVAEDGELEIDVMAPLGVFDPDPAVNSLTFFGGMAGTLTNINIDATALTDPEDYFRLTLDASQVNDNYQFNVSGSATTDLVVKANTGTDNNLIFTGGAGGDVLSIDGADLGQNINFDGDGLGAPSNAVADPGALNSTADLLDLFTSPSTPTINADVLFLTGGAVADDDFFDGANQLIKNLEVLTTDGSPLTAVLGEFAANSGLNVIIGGMADDAVTFDAAFDNNVLVDISDSMGTGGNDVIDAGAIGNTVTFLGEDDDYSATDILTGGTTAGDVAKVRTDDDGNTADLTGVTFVETIDLLDSGNADTTLIVNTQAGDLSPGATAQLITTNGDDPLDGLDNITLLGAAAGANLNVVFTHNGDNTINTGTGDDSILAGTGDDTVNSNTGNDTIDAGDGDNLVNSGTGADDVTTGAGDDSIQTGGDDNAADNVAAGAGADSIIAGTGGDTVDVGADTDADRVQINQADVVGPTVILVEGPVTITSFNALHDTLVFSPVLFADGTATLTTGDPGATQAQGDSWAAGQNGVDDAPAGVGGGDDYPELVAITTPTAPGGADTGLEVAMFLNFNDLPSNMNGQQAIFAITDGTDTYLWHYADDGDGTVAATDFTLIGTVLGVSNLTGANLELNFGFTPGDDVVVVPSGSSVDGLGGNDTVTIFPDNGSPTTLITNSIETINGTSGADTVTLTDNVADPEDADTVDFFSNGGADVVNMGAGQTVVLHSNVTVNVGGGLAIDDDATGLGTDATDETVILADDDSNPLHDVTFTGTGANAGVDSVEGSSAGDTLTWLSNNDISVDGNGGNDTLNGANGGQTMDIEEVETLTAGTGDDDISVEDVALDTADLGTGNDDLTFTATSAGLDVTVEGGGGNDTVTGTDFNAAGSEDVLTLTGVETVDARSGDDSVTADADLVDADLGAGNDDLSLTGGATATVNGGLDSDTVMGSTSGDTLDMTFVESLVANTGDDSITADESLANADLGAGNDTLDYGNASGSDVTATIDGAAGSDTVFGEGGDDSLILTNVESLDTASGDDSVTADGALTNADLGNNDNSLSFTAAATATVTGGSGFDTVNGSTGNDSLDLNDVDTLNAGAGDDTVNGGSSLETANLGAGDDSLTLETGGPSVNADGGAGNDTVTGASDNDSLVLTGVESLTANAGDDGVIVTDSALTNANLGSGNDNLIFQSGAVGGVTTTIDGDAGSADRVEGSAFADDFDLTNVESLDAGAGDDVIVADGTSLNALLGDGDDDISFNAPANASVDGGNGTDTLTGSSGGDTITAQNIEVLDLGGGMDTLVLTPMDDTVTLTGVESVDALAGNDTLTADSDLANAALGAGNDSLTYTSAANATVDGDGGADPGAGNDTVTGSTGDDTFTLTAVETLDASDGADTITADNALNNATLGADVSNDSLTFTSAASATVTDGSNADTDTVTGSGASDSLTLTGVESILADNGDDSITLTGDNAAISIDGGVGVADYVLGSGTDNDVLTLTNVESLQANAGNDTITADGALANADLQAGDDSLTFTAAANGSVKGGIGTDTVTGSSAADTLSLIEVETLVAGTGDDTVTADGSLISANLGNGTNSLTYNAAVTAAMVTGGAGTDTVATAATGTSSLTLTAVEALNAGDGDDTVAADGSLTSANLGNGTNSLTYNAAVTAAMVTGGTGTDTVATADGVASSLTLSGIETFNGGTGDDTVTADGSLTSANLGNGTNSLTYNAAVTAAVVTGGAGTDTVATAATGTSSLTLTAVEALNAGNGDDTVTADGSLTSANLGNGTNSLTYNAAVTAAMVTGGAGTDTVATADGVASSLTLSGIETFNGGTGDDTLTMTTAQYNALTINDAGGNDQVILTDSGTTTADDDIESYVLSSSGSDTITFGGADAVRAGQSVDLTNDGAEDTVIITNATIDPGASSALQIDGFQAGGGMTTFDNLQIGAGSGDDQVFFAANTVDNDIVSTADIIEITNAIATDLNDVSDGGAIESLLADVVDDIFAGTFMVAVEDSSGDVGIYQFELAADVSGAMGNLNTGGFGIEHLATLNGTGSIAGGDLFNSVDNM